MTMVQCSQYNCKLKILIINFKLLNMLKRRHSIYDDGTVIMLSAEFVDLINMLSDYQYFFRSFSINCSFLIKGFNSFRHLKHVI